MTKPKEYFIVKLEGLVPISVSYKILAESPEEAAEIVAKNLPSTRPLEAPKLSIPKLKKLKATVYNAGTTTIRHTKKWA